MKTKICTDRQCVHDGKRQHIDRFPKHKKSAGGRISQCKCCKNRHANELTEPAIERISNDEWLINWVKYKLSRGFVFFHDGFEYVKSSNDQAWLERTVRNG